MSAKHRPLDDADLALIARVKQTPSLYDPRNADFRMAYRKEQEWETVAAALSIEAADARRRWTCLRDRYSRELKQLRLHPNKGEFGKNDFFRFMDFLRKFVKKRRERRPNGSYKYENNWEDNKLPKEMQSKEEEDDAEEDEDEEEEKMEEEVYAEETLGHGKIKYTVTHLLHGQEEEQQPELQHQSSYENKIGAQTTAETEEYAEFVEDTSETYEELAEPQITVSDRNAVINPSPKSIGNNAFIPIMLQQAGSTTYTLTTQHNASTTALPQLQHHPQITQHQQTAPIEQSSAQQQQMSFKQAHFGMTEMTANENEDDFFCKSIAAYLRQLSRRHKIKAKVEMFQILEKYIEIEENATTNMLQNVASQQQREQKR